MNTTHRMLALLGIILLLPACTNLKSATPAQQRRSIIEMSEQVLRNLYQEKPAARSMINNAAGYAVFDNGNVNLLVVSFGGGRGVVFNNETGNTTFMKMAEAGVGIGAGVKDFRLVFVFHNQQTLNRFIKEGWQVGADADAAAKASDKGAAAGGEIVADNITVFQMTESGLALQASIKGTRYWKDSDLN